MLSALYQTGKGACELQLEMEGLCTWMLDREEIEGQELYLKEQNFIRFSIPGRPDAAGENQKLQIAEMKLRGQEATDRYVGMELQIKMTGSDVWTILT